MRSSVDDLAIAEKRILAACVIARDERNSHTNMKLIAVYKSYFVWVIMKPRMNSLPPMSCVALFRLAKRSAHFERICVGASDRPFICIYVMRLILLER